MSQMVRHLASVRGGALAAETGGSSSSTRTAAKAAERITGNQAIFSIMESRMASLMQSNSGSSSRTAARL
jgi:hypothetical protein